MVYKSKSLDPFDAQAAETFNAPGWKNRRKEANMRRCLFSEFWEFHAWNFISPVHIEMILSSFWYFVLEIVIVCIILESTESWICWDPDIHRRPTLWEYCPMPGQVVTLVCTRTSFCLGSDHTQYVRGRGKTYDEHKLCLLNEFLITTMSKREPCWQLSWSTGYENVGEFMKLQCDGWLGPHIAWEVRKE